MDLVFLPANRSDLLWMRTYYTGVFPAGAKRAAEHYRTTFSVIRQNPQIGHPVEDMPGVREFPIQRTPFSIIYRVIDDRIEILRIWDQRGDRSGLI